jgi:hypothetical protein
LGHKELRKNVTLSPEKKDAILGEYFFVNRRKSFEINKTFFWACPGQRRLGQRNHELTLMDTNFSGALCRLGDRALNKRRRERQNHGGKIMDWCREREGGVAAGAAGCSVPSGNEGAAKGAEWVKKLSEFI